MKLDLPEVPQPVAAYVPAMVVGNMVRTSGQLPFRDGELIAKGQLGTPAMTVEVAQDAAKQAALNAIAAAAKAAGGLDNLASVVKVTGFVASTPEFYAQPTVIDAASKFLEDIFGSKHIRSAVGVVSLPLNASVEIEVEFSLK